MNKREFFGERETCSKKISLFLWDLVAFGTKQTVWSFVTLFNDILYFSRGVIVVLHFYMTCCIFRAQNFHLVSVLTPNTQFGLVWYFSVTCCIFCAESLEDQNVTLTDEPLCDTFPWYAVFFACKLFITDDFYDACRNQYGSVQSQHCFLFLMQKMTFFPSTEELVKMSSKWFFSVLAPVSKCRLSYFVLARWVAFDHTLYLSALSTATSSTLSDTFTFINF